MSSSNYRERVQEALRTRCLHLKTKAAFLGLPGADDIESDIDTAIWWCNETCEPLGPDGHTAEPDGCHGQGGERVCYRPPPTLE